MKDDLIIIRTDGGICSQIKFASIGKFFEDKGYHVKYDLTWFEENGHDVDGIKVRNYDIEKAFPSIKFEYASKDEIKKYKKKYTKNLTRTQINQLNRCKPPMYVDRYPSAMNYLPVKYREYFANKFKFNTEDEELTNLLNEIESVNSCGIHVRRGDYLKMSSFIDTIDKNYFLKAINIIKKINNDVKFYFFSDDMDWVKSEIVPELNDINYILCDKNSDDKGYLDLYLLSKCKHIVASNGSFGYSAFLLSNPKETELWSSRYLESLCKYLDNIYIINCPTYGKTDENILNSYMNDLITIKQDKTDHYIVNIFGLKLKFKIKGK